jgi:hypothetical protein
MSEFDKLKDDAEQYGQQHPQQVQEGERDVEKKFGIGGGQPGQNQSQSQSGQQDQYGQDQDQGSQYGQDQGGQDQQQGY